jgi:hypothetical protein
MSKKSPIAKPPKVPSMDKAFPPAKGSGGKGKGKGKGKGC